MPRMVKRPIFGNFYIAYEFCSIAVSLTTGLVPYEDSRFKKRPPLVEHGGDLDANATTRKTNKRLDCPFWTQRGSMQTAMCAVDARITCSALWRISQRFLKLEASCEYHATRATAFSKDARSVVITPSRECLSAQPVDRFAEATGSSLRLWFLQVLAYPRAAM